MCEALIFNNKQTPYHGPSQLQPGHESPATVRLGQSYHLYVKIPGMVSSHDPVVKHCFQAQEDAERAGVGSLGVLKLAIK
jgi:hypothetical protein